jgi:hypothetical protein
MKKKQKTLQVQVKLTTFACIATLAKPLLFYWRWVLSYYKLLQNIWLECYILSLGGVREALFGDKYYPIINFFKTFDFNVIFYL